MGKCVGVWGEEWGRCREVCWGVEPQHTSPHFLPHLIPSSPLTSPHPNTLSYISSHTSSHIFPSSPTPQHIFLLSPHLPSPSQSVAKLPCDEVSVAKLLATICTTYAKNLHHICKVTAPHMQRTISCRLMYSNSSSDGPTVSRAGLGYCGACSKMFAGP